MAFTTVPFTGPLQISSMDFNWCSVSPTKAFIVYSGWTGVTAGAGTRKLFIQAVYFNGKAAPTFGPASAVANLSYTNYLMPTIVSITDGRLVVAMTENASQFSYSVYNVDGSDQVSLSYKHPEMLSQFSSVAVPMVELNGNKVLSTHLTSSSNDYSILTIGDTAITRQLLTGAALYANPYHSAAVLSGITVLTGHSIKRDRQGNILISRSFYGVDQGGYPTNGTQLTTFDKDGVRLFYGRLTTQMYGGVDQTGYQKGREIFPISPSTALNLGATDMNGSGSITLNHNTFVRLTLGSLVGNVVTGENPIPYRDNAIARFDDVIWLDDDYFFALALRPTSWPQTGVRGGLAWDPAAAAAQPQVAYIGKYNDASNSIIMSDSAPLALPNKTYNGAPNSNYIHKISNTEVAILQPVYSGSGVIHEFNVTVVGA